MSYLERQVMLGAKSYFINNVNWLVNNSVSLKMPMDGN